jgi:hypothetical protein
MEGTMSEKLAKFMPSAKTRKAIAAGVLAGGAFLLGVSDDGLTTAEYLEAALIAFGAYTGTWAIPNATSKSASR